MKNIITRIKTQMKTIWAWKIRQFKTNPYRSSSIMISVVAVITLGALFLSGVFTSMHGSYLPNRAYILATAEAKEPQTLDELLHSDAPSVDTLLKNPAIADELLKAESLIDIVDSRFVLNNLRELDRQITERLEESPEDVGLVDLPVVQEPPQSESENGTAQNGTVPGNQTVKSLSASESLVRQSETLTKLNVAMERLLIPSYFGEPVQVDSAINIKGIWQNGEALIHMTPSGDWLPDSGYDLYRVINGEKILVASKVAAPGKGMNGLLTYREINAEDIRSLYGQANLTDKLGELGMTSEQFRQAYYVTDTLAPIPRISGASDFAKMKDLQRTIPGSIEQKIPETDLLTGLPIYLVNRQPNGLYTSTSIQSSIWQKFSVTQTSTLARSNTLASLQGYRAGNAETENNRVALAQSILDARRQITTMSFADKDFAEAANFLIHDDLAALNLPDDTVITYSAEVPGGSTSATLEITLGVEFKLSKPSGLDGYGTDGKVPLRWNEAETLEERSIIIGYNIERKLDGEREFTKINDVPVAISHMLDDSGLYMESVIFHEDEVDNGRGAEYRICSLDIFGRASEYSDVLIINESSTKKVEKVTPPGAPSISAPVLSTDTAGNAPAAVKTAIQQNGGKKGIVLPIYTDSADTARFTVYRAVAVGAGSFGKPEVLADIKYENRMTVSEEESTGSSVYTKTNLKSAKQLSYADPPPAEPNLVYFDADIKEGCTYKYWVSAWDDPQWNNESAWSASVTMGVSSEVQPKTPNALNIKMLTEELPDLSALPPGVMVDSVLTQDALMQTTLKNLPVRQYGAGVDTETAKAAAADKAAIGQFVTGTSNAALSSVITLAYDNLPGDKYIHTFAAIRGEDVKPGGSTMLNWPAYSGGGLKGYVIYKPEFASTPPSLEDMQQMTAKELVEMCGWRKVGGTVTQNQVCVSGLDSTPGSLNLFLICLEPEHNVDSGKYIVDLNAKKTSSENLTEPVKPAIPKMPTLSSLKVTAPGTVKVSLAGVVTVKLTDGRVWSWSANTTWTASDELFTYTCIADAYNIAKNISPDPAVAAVLDIYYSAYQKAYNEYTAARDAYPAALAAYEKALAEYEEAVYLRLISGHVKIEWDAPDDPQIKYYRVYRSEVSKWDFQKGVDESKLDWTMVGDHVTAAQFTDPVEQSIAHYYYYKVTAVTAWGVESTKYTMKSFRVPATVPPATPAMQLPLSSKNGVMVNFSAVAGSDKYVLYRAEIPKLTESQINTLTAENKEIFDVLFKSASADDTFMSNALKNSYGMTNAQAGEVNALSSFKTVLQISKTDLRRDLSTISDQALLDFTQKVVEQYGPLVIADYSRLSIDLMNLVTWKEVGVLPVKEDTKESSDGNNTGLLQPLFIEDNTAQYGHTYLYTVRAWNDDNLGSAASEPVEGTSRRNGPFDPISGIKGTIESDHPSITWNPPKMKKAGLTVEECVRDTVGYIVYRADTEDGPYYQASPMLFNTGWVDTEADIHANNWYNVKVLDTGGYLSDFGKPVSVGVKYVTSLVPNKPIDVSDPDSPPAISFHSERFTIFFGSGFQTEYTLEGAEPITVTVAAKDARGGTVSGFTVDPSGKLVSAPDNLAVGAYTVTATAKNDAGEGTATFILEVTAAASEPSAPSASGEPSAPVVQPPVIKFNNTNFTSQESSAFSAPYTLTGTEPITVTVSAVNRGGAAVSGFTVNTSAKTVNASTSLSAGLYTVTATAKNSAGQSSAAFTLYVNSKPIEPSKAPAVVAPAFAAESHGYAFIFNISTDKEKEYPIKATGSTPITYSLEASPGRAPLLAGISINSSTGVLKVVSGYSDMGTHYFTIRAKNDAGSVTQNCTLTVDRLGMSPTGFNAGSGTPMIMQLAVAQPATPNLVDTNSYQSNALGCLHLSLSDVKLSRANGAAGMLAGYSGTAMLDIGYEERVPVRITGAQIEKANGVGTDKMTKGTVYIDTPFALSKCGMTITSLDVTPDKDKAVVSGYMESTFEGQNLIGNIGVLEFTDAKLNKSSIEISKNLPVIRYDKFIFSEPQLIKINLTAFESGLLSLDYGRVTMKFHLETLDNKGIEFGARPGLRFDLQGRLMSAMFTTSATQSIQLLVPGGAMLRIDPGATLNYNNGKAVANGKLGGRLILPFEQTNTIGSGSGVAGVYAKPAHPDSDPLSILLTSFNSNVPQSLITQMFDGVIHFGETVQSQGLLIVPRDTALQDKCSYVDIAITDWTGEGFVLDNAAMTNTNVADRSLDLETQHKQGFNVMPTKPSGKSVGVTVDLDRGSSLKKQGAPVECSKDFWLGIIINDGKLILPPGYVRTADDTSIEFKLAPGKMLYDLNGFNYQTYLYAPTPEGVKARTGDELGNFPDAWIHDVMVDMYNNKVDFEVNMTVAVDFLMGNKVKAKLYTIEEPDENGNKPGTFLCSVTPTLVKDAVAPGFDMRIDGGWFEPDGMRISGAMLLPGADAGFEVKSADPLAFTDMVIPADRTKTKSEKYGYATLDKPVNVDFNGFTMEARVLDLQSRNRLTQNGASTSNSIHLYGATVLSDNIPLSAENTDKIAMSCSRPTGKLSAPTVPTDLAVSYNTSTSVLTNTFDECFTVGGILTPKQQDGNRFMEYETADLAFGFLDALDVIPFKTETRFGRDTELDRNYFAIKLIYDGMPVEFGAGQIRDVTGLISYNMVVERDANQHNRYKFPNHVKEMDVYTGNGTKFAAAIRGILNIEHLCEIRDMYFAFESGPIVEAGGDFYVPLDPGAMLSTKDKPDAYTKIGSVVIMYNHPNRHFSINADLKAEVLNVSLTGSISLQYNQKLFGVYIGYPETLTAKLPPFKAGAGFAFQTAKNDSFVAAKMALGIDYDLSIKIVYIRGFVEAGAGGEYHFDDGSFAMDVYLKGGIKGGIWFGGRHDIISFYLNADGSLSKAATGKWKLDASCKVSYSLDLFLTSVSGSVKANFSKTF